MDVYSSVQPVFQVSRLLGFAPFRLVGSVGKRSFVVSKWRFLLSLLFLSVLIYFFINYGFENIFITSLPFGSLQVVNAQQRIVDEILAVVVIVIGWLTSLNWTRFYAGIDVVDTCLLRIGVTVSHSTAFWTSLVTLVGSVSLSVVGTTALRCYYDMGGISGPYSPEIITQFFCENLTNVVNNLFAISFVDCVLLLRRRFALINAQLVDDVKVPEKIFVSRHVDVSLLPTLQTLRRLHDQLCDLAQELNGVFSFQLLIYVAASFMNLACKLNNAVKSMLNINKNPDDKMAPAFMAFNLYGVLITVVHTGCLAGVCNLTHKVANHTPLLVSKLLMKKSHSELKQELSEFSTQLLHRKVQFTAFEFFPLDATLICSIVGGITTYLVILVQFQ